MSASRLLGQDALASYRDNARENLAIRGGLVGRLALAALKLVQLALKSGTALLFHTQCAGQ